MAEHIFPIARINSAYSNEHQCTQEEMIPFVLDLPRHQRFASHFLAMKLATQQILAEVLGKETSYHNDNYSGNLSNTLLISISACETSTWLCRSYFWKCCNFCCIFFFPLMLPIWWGPCICWQISTMRKYRLLRTIFNLRWSLNILSLSLER
jgi:hypothetical protein